MKLLAVLIGILSFFVAVPYVHAVECEFVDDHQTSPGVPCDYDGVTYDRSIQWWVGDGYEYNTWWVDSDTTVVTASGTLATHIYSYPSGQVLEANWSAPSTLNASVGYYNCGGAPGCGLGSVLGTVWSHPPTFDDGVDDFIYLVSPCAATENQCSIATSSTSVIGQLVIDWSKNPPTTDYYQVNFSLFDGTSGALIDSVGFGISSTTELVTGGFLLSGTSTVYQLVAEMVPSGSVAGFGYGWSDSQYVYLGDITGDFMGINLFESDNSQTAWTENGCDALSITDIFPAIRCAFIWAFYPSGDTLAKFQGNLYKVAHLYPIGYATLIYEDLASSTSATSTAFFNSQINFGRWFGRSEFSTTTIVADALLEYSNMASPILEWLELLLWILFVGWLMIWGITRKL